MAIAEAELRGIVREILSDALPKLKQSAEVRQVRIANDGDLAALVAEVLALASDKSSAARLRSGLLRFTLGDAPAAASAAPAQARPQVQAQTPAAAPAAAEPAAQAPSSVLRIEKGAITERVIAQAAQSGARLVLGPRAVLTPLAREGARKHRVVIERAS